MSDTSAALSAALLAMRPTPLPADLHLRGKENYNVWCIQICSIVGSNAWAIMQGSLTREDCTRLGRTVAEFDALNNTTLARTGLALCNGICPNNVQGKFRLLHHFWLLALPTATAEALDLSAQEYKATLAALKAAEVALELIFLSHLLAALPSSLATLQTTISVSCCCTSGSAG
ncbi:uncharacterized protein JCM10292_003906 [Rhodotorula paludigena]|uniref:uncharacterized protein n=1 Tax=Rhodotorula paludigena TaxID=86838 RepID=UPI003180BA82